MVYLQVPCNMTEDFQNWSYLIIIFLQIFGTMLGLDFFKDWCKMAFPEYTWEDNKFSNEMTNTNTEYGGFIPWVQNVVFVHGSIDPWHAMGVLEV